MIDPRLEAELKPGGQPITIGLLIAKERSVTIEETNAALVNLEQRIVELERQR